MASYVLGVRMGAASDRWRRRAKTSKARLKKELKEARQENAQLRRLVEAVGKPNTVAEGTAYAGVLIEAMGRLDERARMRHALYRVQAFDSLLPQLATDLREEIDALLVSEDEPAVSPTTARSKKTRRRKKRS